MINSTEDNYYMIIEFAGQSELGSLGEVDKDIMEGGNSTLHKCSVIKSFDLSNDQFIELSQSLMESNHNLWVDGLGRGRSGWQLDYGISLEKAQDILDGLRSEKGLPSVDLRVRLHADEGWFALIEAGYMYLPVVEVTSAGQEPFYVDPQGCNYAKYAGRDARVVLDKRRKLEICEFKLAISGRRKKLRELYQIEVESKEAREGVLEEILRLEEENIRDRTTIATIEMRMDQAFEFRPIPF